MENDSHDRYAADRHGESADNSAHDRPVSPARLDVDRDKPLESASSRDPLRELRSAIGASQSPEEFFRRDDQRIQDLVDGIRSTPYAPGTRCVNSWSNFELTLSNPNVAEFVRVSVALGSLATQVLL